MLIALTIRRAIRLRRTLPAGYQRPFRPKLDVETVAALVAFAACAAAFLSAASWQWEARIMPQVAAALGGIMAAGSIMAHWFKPIEAPGPEGGKGRLEKEAPTDEVFYDVVTDFGLLERGVIGVRALRYGAFLLVFWVLAWLIGVLPAVPVFILCYMLFSGERLRVALPVAAGMMVGVYLIFEYLLALPWPAPVWNLLAFL